MNISISREQQVILCVDDDAQLLETLEYLLSKNFPTYRVVACINGQDAIEQMQECKATGQEIQLVITDQVMGDLTGIDVLSRVPDLYPDAVRVILTGQAGLKSAIDAIKLGVNDYLEKPVTEAELVKTLRMHLNNYLLKQDNKRLQEFVKRTHLRTSEITDLAFRSFNYHLTRLLTNDGDRREVVEAIRKARENINLLSHLYKVNYAMARGESFEVVMPDALVEEALRYVKGKNGQGIMLERGQRVLVESHEPDTELHGNRSVLRIVLERILENACKYSPKGATITITIRGPQYCSAPDQKAASLQPDLLELLRQGFTIVSVADEGTPTQDDFQSLLYVQEWQQPSKEDYPTLKGLGLVIAQEYLFIMGGHLFIDAKVGHKGSIVHVAFPNDARGGVGSGFEPVV